MKEERPSDSVISAAETTLGKKEHDVIAMVRTSLASGRDGADVLRELREAGVSDDASMWFVLRAQELARSRTRQTQMIVGGLACAIGLAVTIGT